MDYIFIDTTEFKPCEWRHEEFEDSDLIETNLGFLCDSCIRAIVSRGEEVWIKA